MPVTGLDTLRAIDVRLKAMSDGAVIKRRMNRNIRAAAVPLKAKLSASAEKKLPHGGGLNEVVARQRITVSILGGPNAAGVRLRQSHHDAVTTNSGWVRHPVYGNKKKWVIQHLPAAEGWWSSVANRAAVAEAVPPMLAVLEEVAIQIARGA